MHTLNNTPVDMRLLNTLTVFRFCIATWLLSFYLLPNTMWARISPVAILVREIDLFRVAFMLPILSVLLCGTVLLLARSTYPLARRAAPIWLLIAAYFFAGIYALIISRNNWILFRTVGELLTAIMIGLYCVALSGNVYRMTLLICILGLTQAIYTLYYHHIGVNDLVSGVVHRAGGTFNQPNGVYTVMIIALPLSLAQALNPKPVKFKELFTLSAPIMFAALIVTWDRGGTLGAMVGVAWVAWNCFGNKLGAILVCIILACIVIFVAQYRVQGNVNASSSSRSIESRQEVWVGGTQLFLKNWLTGVGVGGVAISIPANTPDTSSPSTITADEPKNVFLLWLDELGIAGGILFAFFSFSIYSIVSASRSNPSALAIGAAWIALFIASLSDTTFATGLRPYGNALWGCLLFATALLQSETCARPLIISSKGQANMHLVKGH